MITCAPAGCRALLQSASQKRTLWGPTLCLVKRVRLEWILMQEACVVKNKIKSLSLQGSSECDHSHLLHNAWKAEKNMFFFFKSKNILKWLQSQSWPRGNNNIFQRNNLFLFKKDIIQVSKLISLDGSENYKQQSSWKYFEKDWVLYKRKLVVTVLDFAILPP